MNIQSLFPDCKDESILRKANILFCLLIELTQKLLTIFTDAEKVFDKTENPFYIEIIQWYSKNWEP